MKGIRFQILNIVHDICVDDSFKIIDINDILIALPTEINIEEEKIFEIIDEMALEDEINLKYYDDENICLAMSNKGRRIVKKERELQEKLRLKAEAEAKRKAEEAKRKAEEEARRKAEEEAKRKAEEERKALEARLKAEAEAKIKAEKERLEKERLEKEKILEETRRQLEEAQSKRKTKKDAIELQEKVEQIEKEIEKVEETKQEILVPKKEIEEKEVKVQEVVENKPVQIVEEERIPIDIIPDTVDYRRISKSLKGRAFWGALLGGFMGSASVTFAMHFILKLIG